MIRVIDTLINILLLLLAVLFVAGSSSAMGVVGFFFAMGWIFMAIILFAVVMTIIEFFDTGKWWFLEPRK